MIAGSRIVVGVSGGIAAYKAVEVIRRLVDAGAHVAPVMTEGAAHFIGETTLSALSSEKVQTSLWDETSPIPHTRLGQNADLIVVAPATARLLSDYATGRSDDLLTATLIASRAPVIVCPAMHTEMWEHPSVQDNVSTLRSRGVIVVDPEEGRLAGGDVGAGRLAAPEVIVAAVERVLTPPDLAGLSVLITAGGTREPIDPVRFIGNRSSGRQGHALAEEAAARGAVVTLVTTTSLPVPAGVERVGVATAAEMHEAVLSRSEAADIVVMAAAVADFTPVTVAEHKIKKTDGVPIVELRPTADTLAALGASKTPGQTIVGFAAETFDVEANALGKLTRKGADLIVANDVAAPGVGFEHETNSVTILCASGRRHEVGLTSKRAVAREILDLIVDERRS
ncbi:MAG TPA: bifunctional phosphopantothenoylcysteine decarboxylase/phosphopantothenate--cysteine ligase CoaBC [Microthrixaceae bacterium]|nr:bifunctional phosphopantothenoylcysteine decarboxylase/phosphopantothenate--cysteine ligase CoaBC [Microthrixaceae bacterium]